MKRPSYSFVFVAVAVLVMATVTAVNFFVDPFTYYHQPWTAINFNKLHRFSNPGLARQFDYKSVLVGTSHVMELKSSTFSEIIGEPGLNLSMNGSLFREQSELTSLVLRQNKASTVYWEMNYPSLNLGDAMNGLGQQFPQYFYTPTIETPFRYLVSFDTLLESWKALKNPGSVTIDNRNQLVKREFSEHRVLQNWDYELGLWNPGLVRYWIDIQKSVESPGSVLEKRLVPLLENHPRVTFKLFLPPHTLFIYLLHDAMGADDFSKWLAFRNQLAGYAEKYPNVELHDFQTDWSTVEDFSLFRDIEHYKSEVLESIFTQVSSQVRLVSEAEAISNSAELRQRVISFGIEFCGAAPGRCTPFLESRLGIVRATGKNLQ